MKIKLHIFIKSYSNVNKKLYIALALILNISTLAMQERPIEKLSESEKESQSRAIFHTIWQHRYLDLQTIKPENYSRLSHLLSTRTCKVFDSNTAWLNHLEFDCKENQIMAKIARNPLALWDIGTGKKLQINSLLKFFKNKQKRRLTRLIDDGQTLEIKMTKPRNKIILQGHTDKINCSALNPSANQIATGSRDTTIRLWNLITGKQIHLLAQHKKPVTCIQYSHDGTQLASGSEDNCIMLWDTTRGILLQIFNKHTKSIVCLTFSPSDKLLASGARDSKICIWNIALLKKFREKISKSLHIQQILLLDQICANIAKGLTTIIQQDSGEHAIFRSLPPSLYACLINYVEIT